MHRKITVLSLILFILLSQTAFAPVQAAEENATSAFPNEMIALVSDSDVVAIIDMRRMLNETAPDLLNNEPASMEKLKKLAKLIEDETGIDPYQVSQVAAGLNFKENKPKDLMVVVRTEAAASEIAERMFQKDVAEARLATEKNPLRNRLSTLRFRAVSYDYVSAIPTEQDGENGAANAQREVEKLNRKFAEYRDKFNELKSLTGAVKASPTAVKSLTDTTEKIGGLLYVYSTMMEAAGDLRFEKEITGIAEMEKELAAISVSDAQRASKLAQITGAVAEAEKDFDKRLSAIDTVAGFKDEEPNAPVSVSRLEDAIEQLKKLPAAAAPRARSLQKVQAQLDEFLKELENKQRRIDDMKAAETEKTVIYPLYVGVSKRDETVSGKKALIITTKNRINGEKGADDEGDYTTEKAILLYDDKTLIFGTKADVSRLISAPAATETQQRMSRMLSKVPNSLVSFAVNLQGVDLGEINELAGGQDKVWEIYGGWMSVSKEMTLSVAVEKTDIPLVVAPKPAETASAGSKKVKIPVIEDNSAAADLFKLLAKTVVGAEGKFTLKFEKRKIASLIRETPKLLGALLDGEDDIATGSGSK